MSQLVILGSGSSGNCALLKTPRCTVLIDIGFSGKQLEEILGQQGYRLEEVDAVFLTHEHQDHTAGLLGLSKYKHLNFFANRGTAEALEARLKRSVRWNYFESGSGFEYQDLQVESFSIPHDAYDPVGFIFHIVQEEACKEGKETALENRAEGERKTSIGFITDLGYVPPGILERMKQVQYLVLEANYDETLLENDKRRPWSLKQRIRGRHGHLSNTAALETLQALKESSVKQVLLGHLSRDCNDVGHLEKLLEAQGELPFAVRILDPHQAHCIVPLEIGRAIAEREFCIQEQQLLAFMKG